MRAPPVIGLVVAWCAAPGRPWSVGPPAPVALGRDLCDGRRCVARRAIPRVEWNAQWAAEDAALDDDDDEALAGRGLIEAEGPALSFACGTASRLDAALADRMTTSSSSPRAAPQEEEDAGVRAALASWSRSRWGEAIKAGHVRVNGVASTKKAHALLPGDVVSVDALAATAALLEASRRARPITPEAIPLDVLYEDEDLLVINKAPGLVTHPAPGHRTGTLVNALAFREAEQQQQKAAATNGGAGGSSLFFRDAATPRPGVVHRLDKGTSGAIVVAKHDAARAALAESFARREVEKLYLAACGGKAPREGLVDVPVARHPTRRDRMTAVLEDPEDDDDFFDGGGHDRDTGRHRRTVQRGREARSIVRVLAEDGRRSVVEVNIETGRTHQIRVHLAQVLRAPVLGDDVYGDPTHNRNAAKPPLRITRPLLHAWQLTFPHPRTRQRLRVTAPPPDDVKRAIALVSGLESAEAVASGISLR